MCIAIHQPRNTTLKKRTLRKCWDVNPDGAGLMFADGGEVRTSKHSTFDGFYTEYSKVKRTIDPADLVIHFRIATHGGINERNTHPHQVNLNTWLVHNGVISQQCVKGSMLSDSIHFAKLLGNLPLNFTNNKAIMELISDYIDTDKIIFLNSSGEVNIVNRELGFEKYGCWFSNSYPFKAPVVYKRFSFNDYDCQSCKRGISEREDEETGGLCYECLYEHYQYPSGAVGVTH